MATKEFDKLTTGVAVAKSTADEALSIIRLHIDQCKEREAGAVKRTDQLRADVTKAIDKLTEAVEKNRAELSRSTRRVHARIDKVLWSVAGVVIVGFVNALVSMLGNGAPWP